MILAGRRVRWDQRSSDGGRDPNGIVVACERGADFGWLLLVLRDDGTLTDICPSQVVVEPPAGAPFR